MTVTASTAQTYGFTTIREDLSNVVDKISPTETPVMSAIGRGDADNTLYEWSTVDLAAADEDNAVIEGDNPANDAPTVSVRLSNYTQLMDKIKQVSSTSQAVKSAGDITKMAKQILFGTQEIKRDMEKRLCGKKAADAGGAAEARQTASLSAFLQTNVSRGAGGADPVLSGTTTGFPTTAATDGTPREFTETLLKDVVQGAWEQGGEPTMVVVGAYNKRVASGFTGNATRTKDAEDKKIVAAVDVYVSDFGELQIVPDRFTTTSQALILDPSKASVEWLQKMKNEALAKTGHSIRRMVSCEWGSKVDNERAHGLVADLTTAAA